MEWRIKVNKVDSSVYEEGAPFEAALKAALQDAADCPEPSAGFARRVEALVEAQSPASGRRWGRVAASVAICASLAGFAAWQVATLGETGEVAAEVPTEAEVNDDASASGPKETLEDIFGEKTIEPNKETVMNGIQKMAATAATLAAVATAPAQDAVKGNVFDDVKVWYKGSAGNAVGTADSSTVTKIKSLPNLADASSSMHGGDYFWWGWRLQYANQDVDCPYAGVTLGSTPCMVVPSNNDPTGYVTVTINGEETTQPYWTSRRFGDLHFSSWMSDWEAGTVCSNYTVVLRFKSKAVNPVSGCPNAILAFGFDWNSTAGVPAGFSLKWNTPDALGTHAVPRLTVGKTMEDFRDCKVPDGHWVDLAIAVNGQQMSMWLCWNDSTTEIRTNRLVKIDRTYTGGWPTVKGKSVAYLASGKDTYGATWTNGVYSADVNGKGFEGAFHQVAFWDRTLSSDEIREAMAGGTGRPNIVQVGIEGNGIAEFATSSQTDSVSNTGTWENLNPTLTAANPTATIAFTCPALWAGKPQYLRVPMAATSTAGKLSVALNNETLGLVDVAAGKVALLYIPGEKIVFGGNTLVLARTDGEALVLDAVTLGGSWQFGKNVGSFGYQSSVESNPDRYTFNPACGSDEIHNRGTFNNGGNRETSFDFFVPADMVGKFRGVFTTRVQNTGGNSMPYSFHVNGAKIDDFTLKGGTETEVKIPANVINVGWNRAYWKTTSSGYWANIDWHKFEVEPPQKGLALIIR